MLTELKAISTVTLILFAIIDVLGSVPVILDIKSKVGHVDAKYATAVSGLIMIIFLFTGSTLLSLIGIDIASFSLAGSIVIFLIGLEMTLNRDIFKSNNSTPKSTSIVPIAFPIIAGSGTLTTIMSLKSSLNDFNIIAAILINMVIIFLALKSLALIPKFLGRSGQIAVRKFFGVILLAISVKIFRTNLGF